MPQMIFLVIAIIAVALLALVAMVLSGKRRHEFDKQEYQARWLKIKNSLDQGDRRSYNYTVLEADKLLYKALDEMGIPGKTMGEKLKKIGDKMPEINRIWQAHKIRNQIAHESDFELSYEQARRALAIFQQALKDIGAI